MKVEADLQRVPRVAYLCSVYARASHTFIRSEVGCLRELGFDVRTFSVREPDPLELVDEATRNAARSTEVILRAGLLALSWAFLLEALRSPRRMAEALGLALRIGWPGLKGRLWPFAYLAEASWLARRLRSLGIEHLHNHFGEGCASVAMLTSTLACLPYSFTVHGPAEFDRPESLALGLKVKRSAFTVAVCEFGRAQLHRWTDPVDWPKIHVVRCGVDATLLNRDSTPLRDGPHLVCVGRLDAQKGQLTLLEAAAMLAREGREFKLTLVGDGPTRGLIEERIASLGLAGRLHLAGWLGAKEVHCEVKKARALVAPGLAEGLPVVLMEAFALGRPVIATNVAGVAELVTPRVSGWLVPAGSAVELAAALAEALDTPPDQLTRMGQAGQEKVRQKHDGVREAEHLARLFRLMPENQTRRESELPVAHRS